MSTSSSSTSSSRRPPPPPSHPGQLDPSIDKWSEWNNYATDMSCDWVNLDNIQVFKNALSDETADSSLNNNDLTSGTTTPNPNPPTEKIRAVSDFAPIKERVRRGPKRRRDIVREGWAYHLSRWPLLFLIFTIIFFEFVAYFIVRQVVNVMEFFSAWRGERGKLRVALRNATTYEEWKSRALELDEHLDLTSWKRSAPNAYYDAPLVRRVVKTLRELRQDKQDAEGVCAVLHAVLKSNFAGTESFRLYSESYYGTKDLVQEFIDEVTRCLIYVRSLPPSILPLSDKLDFFRSSAKNLGASALCLSGGASFGYYHFGVIRALLDQGLLPRVVTGTSAGALVAAFICCRTDSEISQLLTPTLADRITACSEPFNVWIRRAWRTGARFDTIEWAKKSSFFTMGSMTFKEAFERTGRILNVSVIPFDTHSPTKLLNYLTAPDCVIFTAIIASAAVPGILNPVVLLKKDKLGKLHPWEFQGKHKDGSLRVDIPLHALNLLYNVNFSLVSQVNPHVHLFAFSPRGAPGRPVAHRSGKGWRGGFLLSAAEQYLKIELMKNFRVIRDLELLPEFGGQNWSAVFLQKFEGSVTIWPKSRIKDWFRLLTDPDRDELARMIRVGQMVTWPKIKMIENRLKIERQIDLGREELRRAISEKTSNHQSNGGHQVDEGPQQPPPPLVHRTSSDFLDSPAGFESRSQSPHRLNHHSTTSSEAVASRLRDHGDYLDAEDDGDGEEEEEEEEEEGERRFPTRDEEFIDRAQEEEGWRERRRRDGSTPVDDDRSVGHVAQGGGENDKTPAAKRRQAILARLGLNGVSTNDQSKGGQSRRRWASSGGGGGGERDGESDFTAESGGESAGSLSAGGRPGLRRRRYSMGSVGGRPRAGTISSEDEGGWR